VTLISDFQTADFYVAAMKAVLLSFCRDVCLIDVTHEVPRHDIVAGSIVLERALASFPPATLHLAVVDPGVGTQRRVIIAEVAGQIVVCPDNGLITWSLQRLNCKRTHELTWRPSTSSTTFHGRDVMAPAIGILLQGRPISDIAKPLEHPFTLDLHLAESGQRGQIIHIDAFGNATTNVPEAMVRAHPHAAVYIAGSNVGPVRATYADVEIGQPLALIGSSGLLEIAIREGSAASQLQLRVGDVLTLHP